MPITRRTLIAGIAAAPGLARASVAPGSAYDVAVVGAGVFGAWTAWHLTKAGRSVALIDAYGVGHARASSGGESRVIRLGYGRDTLYTDMAAAALEQWQALSWKQGTPILHHTGVLWFAPSAEDYTRQALTALEARGVPLWKGDAAALRKTFPQMRFADEEAGFVEQESGALMAGRGVQAVVADAGLECVRALAGPPAKSGDGLLAVGGVRARALVYACGPWLPKLFPALLKDRIVATRQEVYHFGAAAGDARFAPPKLCVWADFNGGDIVYGFPDLEGQGFKMAFDGHGPVIDPDTQDRRPSPEGVERARAYLARRFPDLAAAPLVHARVCQYENSSNGDFLIDTHPDFANVWLVGGGSGHGFKHGPMVGKYVADRITNPGLAREPRFSLASKAVAQKRTVY